MFCSTAIHENLGNVPKIFILDMHDNDNNNEEHKNNQINKTNSTKKNKSYFITLCSTKNGIFKGSLSEYTTKSIHDAHDKDIPFGTIYKNAGDELLKQQQQLILMDYDKSIDNIKLCHCRLLRPATPEFDDDEEDAVLPKTDQIIAEYLQDIKKNDIVILDDNRKGILRFGGHVPRPDGDIQFGIELIDGDGEHNGTKNDVYYFECPKKKGIFVTKEQIIKKIVK